MKFLTPMLGLASVASAHTVFTRLWVNGENQGDGTCIRMRKDASKATYPLEPVTGDVMACGYDGDKPVPYICPVPGSSTVTFEFREYPGENTAGAISEGHRGPCAVYLKKVDDMFSDSATGGGWFKIWEDGYDQKKDRWCVDTLIENKGLITVNLPSGLPPGYYLARPEILALHNANQGDPQFYSSCAQIFIESGPEGPLEVPDNYTVSIPGYVSMKDPGLTYNLYEQPHPNYIMPGPEVYLPTSKSSVVSTKQLVGAIPADCLIKNGNWCGKPIAKYSGDKNCWAGSRDCWAQSKKCWDSAQPSGGLNCDVWNKYCTEIDNECTAGNFEGPPKFTAKPQSYDLPSTLPKAYDGFDSPSSGEKSVVEKPSSNDEKTSTGPGYAAPSTATSQLSKETQSAPKSSDDESSALKVSQDGRCGGSTGQTCEGSVFGDCCSKKGRCGRKTRHCTCGCQADFGKCSQ